MAEQLALFDVSAKKTQVQINEKKKRNYEDIWNGKFGSGQKTIIKL